MKILRKLLEWFGEPVWEAVSNERGDFLFGGGDTEVTIQAPPSAPAAPPMSEEEKAILDLERQIGLINLQIQQEQERQDQAIRTALEKQYGKSLADVLAGQIFQQSQFQTQMQTEQAAALERARTEREAFQRLMGISPEEASAKAILDQLELSALTRSTQKQILEQADRERQAFIAATGLTPEEAQAQEAQRQRLLSEDLFKRFQAGLAGTLPVSPGLERGLAEQRQALVDSLRQSLGPGFAQSTPGITALAEFDKRAEELRDAARRGAISEAEQFGFGLTPATERTRLARNVALSGAQSAGLGPLTTAATGQLMGRDMIGAPITSPIQTVIPFTQRALLQTPPQLTSVRGALQGERAFQFQPQMTEYQNMVNYTNALNQARIGASGARAQATGNLLNALIGAGGTLGAAYLTRGGRSAAPTYNYYAGMGPW